MISHLSNEIPYLFIHFKIIGTEEVFFGGFFILFFKRYYFGNIEKTYDFHFKVPSSCFLDSGITMRLLHYRGCFLFESRKSNFESSFIPETPTLFPVDRYLLPTTLFFELSHVMMIMSRRGARHLCSIDR